MGRSGENSRSRRPDTFLCLKARLLSARGLLTGEGLRSTPVPNVPTGSSGKPGPSSRTSRTPDSPDNHRAAFVRSTVNVSGRRRHLHFNSTGLDRGRRFFVVRVRLSRAGAQGLRWGIKATHNGCLWLITGHKASAFLPAPPSTTKPP